MRIISELTIINDKTHIAVIQPLSDRAIFNSFSANREVHNKERGDHIIMMPTARHDSFCHKLNPPSVSKDFAFTLSTLLRLYQIVNTIQFSPLYQIFLSFT